MTTPTNPSAGSQDLEALMASGRRDLRPGLRLDVLAGVGLADDHSIVDTPLGPMTIAFNTRGISFLTDTTDTEVFAARFRSRLGDRPLRAAATTPTELADAVASGETGQLTVDLRSATEFQLDVLTAARSIPAGEIRSYGWVAETIGRPKAVRAVGSALATNPVPLVIPCHRIVKADGSPGQYIFGANRKEQLLREEAEANR